MVMKAFQRKRNIQNTHHDIQPVQAQFQSRPFAEPQAETKSVSENTSSLQSGNSKPGFNFAEILLYPTQPQVTAPVQPKFTFAQAKLESSIVQREEQEEEPQAKLESGIVQRSEEDDEPQAKLESGIVQRAEEEEEPQAKLESGGENINNATFAADAKGFIEDISQNIQQGEHLSVGEVIANRSLNYAELIKASPLSSIAGSVVSFLTSAYSIYDSYSIRKALKTAAMAKNKIDPDSVDWSNQEEADQYFATQTFDYGAILSGDDQVMQSAEYGYAKVSRRFYRSIYHTVNSFIKMISDILCVTGIGIIPGAIIKTAQGVLKFAEVAMDKIKGFIKIITGRRGVGRKINAEHIVEAAFKGNQRALQLLVDLDPIGLLFRILGPTGKKGMIKKPKNIEEMMQLLEKTRSDPKNYGTEGQFVSAVAEKLKSL